MTDVALCLLGKSSSGVLGDNFDDLANCFHHVVLDLGEVGRSGGGDEGVG